MSALRSIGAVVAGLVFIVVTHTGIDAVMHATGVFPPAGQPMSDGLWALAVAYRVVFSVAGCWLTARLAGARPMAHAIALGIVGIAVGTAGAAFTWNKGPAFGPHWYPLRRSPSQKTSCAAAAKRSSSSPSSSICWISARKSRASTCRSS